MTDLKVDISIRRDGAVGKVRPTQNADVAVPFIRIENMQAQAAADEKRTLDIDHSDGRFS
jgi:hypothetical protein